MNCRGKQADFNTENGIDLASKYRLKYIQSNPVSYEQLVLYAPNRKIMNK